LVDRTPADRPTLTGLPDRARLWTFGADRPLAAEEHDRLIEATGRFIEKWAAEAAASGCSIDALVGHVRELERELDLTLVDASPIWFRDGRGIRSVGRAEFRTLAEGGEVNGGTPVFDLTVQRLGELRAGRWELPAQDSWHARLLPPGIS
jgi:hypothetical protein